MNLEPVGLFLFGVFCGVAIAVWRTWAYARKLIHFGVTLDAWSDYSEAQEQAHGAAERRVLEGGTRTALTPPQRPAIVHTERLRS